MKMTTIKKFPFLNIPIIGGVFGVFAAVFLVFRGVISISQEDMKTVYRTTYVKGDGSSYTTENRGTFLPIILFLFFLGWVFALPGILVEIFGLLFASPMLFLFPFCLTGLISALDKEGIEKYFSNREEKHSWLIHLFFIVGVVFSFVLAHDLSKTKIFTTKELGFIFLYIPISLFIFLAFIGPIQVGIRSTLNYYRRKHGWSIIKNRLNLALVISMLVAMHLYMTFYDEMKYGVRPQTKQKLALSKSTYEQMKWRPATWLNNQIEEPKNWLNHYIETPYNHFVDGIVYVVNALGFNDEKLVKEARQDKVFKEKGMTLLKLKARPSHAKIQVLNYGEHYFMNPIVQPGEYEVRVTADGYFTFRDTINVEPGLFKKLIKLEKMNPDEYRKGVQKVNDPLFIRVEPTPTWATVQIINIKEKYHPGMVVKPGQYDIKVSARGYKTYQKTYRVKDEGLDVRIRLELDKSH